MHTGDTILELEKLAIKKLVEATKQEMELGTSDPIEDLMFASYRQQRNQFPDIAPERWGRIYPNQVELEARYQQEREEYTATTMKQLGRWMVERGANA